MKTLFRLPGILLPATFILYLVIVGVATLILRRDDYYYTVMPATLEFWMGFVVVMVSYSLHVLLGQKKLLPPLWACLQVILTLLPVIISAFADCTALRTAKIEELEGPRFANNPLDAILFLIKPLLWSLAVAATAQIVFWAYAVIALLTRSKQQATQK